MLGNLGVNGQGSQDLKAHDDTCQFKIIACTIDGCGHECRRKDMGDHLSGGGFLQHLDMMKRSITASCNEKIDTLKLSMQASHDREIAEMKQQISSLKSKQADMKMSL